jgi:succinylglutamate desuccinylase
MSGTLTDALSALARGGPGPRLPVRIAAPDIRRWMDGNAARGAWSFAAEAPGPHVCVVALTHGNEIGGAIVLDRWLRHELRPVAGRLSLIFANLDAYARFDAQDPTASRFLEQDLNRVWDREILEGPGRSSELRRARVLRPLLDSADIVFDMHSMLWPADPLLLVGGQASEGLAMALGTPPLVVSDPGHEAGRRMIDYAAGAGSRGVLLEAGNHWERETVTLMESTARRMLALCGTLPGPVPAAVPARLARVTQAITARSADFAFLQPYRGGDVIAEAGTLIAFDGETEIRTPHDDCLLVMPSLRSAPGLTAVRFAQFVA